MKISKRKYAALMRVLRNLPARLHDEAEQSNMTEQIAHITGGGTSRLNPRFVAEMMGFPSCWTELPFLRGVQSR